nr:MAG TPA: hypothetical protein [Caudoviricetes sp.]
MKFSTIKYDIEKGRHLDYYFTWYKYRVNVSVLQDVLLYTITDEEGSSVSFTVCKEDYMKMTYKELLKIVNQNLYYGEWC